MPADAVTHRARCRSASSCCEISFAYSLRFCSICCRTIFADFEFCNSDCTSTTSTFKAGGAAGGEGGRLLCLGIAEARSRPEQARPAGRYPRGLTTSEPRTETDVKDLRLVERFLRERIGHIEADRPDRRFPGDTDPGAGAQRRRILRRSAQRRRSRPAAAESVS